MKCITNRATALMFAAVCFPSAAHPQHYEQVNLDSNVQGNAEATDPQLINGWGLARSSSSAWWVSNEATGVATLYNGPGAKQGLVVTIPKSDPNDKTFPTGTPTGMIASSNTTDFPAAPGKPAAFIFSTLDGSIAAWNPTVGLAQGANPPSTNAVTVARGAAGSGYTGLASAFIDGNRYLYAANFLKGRIDVFDNGFKPVTLKSDDHNPYDHSGDDDFFGG